MQKSKFDELRYNERLEIKSLWTMRVNSDTLKNFMEELGFTFETTSFGSYWKHPTVTINGIFSVYNSFDISVLNKIGVCNKKTHIPLSYKGYKCFGAYIVDKIYDEILGKRWHELGCLNSYQNTKIKEMFFSELKEHFNACKLKIEKQEKKNKIKDKIQQIEGDIDYAILDYYEEHKDKGIELDKGPVGLQNVSVVYVFKKLVQGMGNVCGAIFTIRKTKNGTWEFYYKDNSWITTSDTKIRCLKKNVTPEDVKKLLDGYFSPWYEIPKDINPKWSFSLNNISEYKNGK